MIRLDQLLLEQGLVEDAKEATSLILAGKVLLDERVIDKPGTPVSPGSSIRIKKSLPYVSRGGLKLEAALVHFNIDPQGWICSDIGASTGGFTDCLLQRGASKVYAVDVAYGQLAWKLRSDERVVVVERCNVRQLDRQHIPQAINLAVFDTSFISLTKVIPPVLPLFTAPVRILALVKPQFELSRDKVGAGGIVTSNMHRMEAVEKIIQFGTDHGLTSHGHTASPITGAKGNQEYLIYLRSDE